MCSWDSSGAFPAVMCLIVQELWAQVMGDLVEALTGAVFLDTGQDLDATWQVRHDFAHRCFISFCGCQVKVKITTLWPPQEGVLHKLQFHWTRIYCLCRQGPFNLQLHMINGGPLHMLSELQVHMSQRVGFLLRHVPHVQDTICKCSLCVT